MPNRLSPTRRNLPWSTLVLAGAASALALAAGGCRGNGDREVHIHEDEPDVENVHIHEDDPDVEHVHIHDNDD